MTNNEILAEIENNIMTEKTRRVELIVEAIKHHFENLRFGNTDFETCMNRVERAYQIGIEKKAITDEFKTALNNILFNNLK